MVEGAGVSLTTRTAPRGVSQTRENPAALPAAATGGSMPPSLVWDGESLNEVLAWIRHVDDTSPALTRIAGVSSRELKHLARVGALIRDRLEGDKTKALLDNGLTAPTPITPTVEARTAFGRLVRHNAVAHLAELYAAVVRPAHRRALGTFFTPRDAARSMVEGYASRHVAPSVVVDVGAGVGIFSEVAHEQWPAADIHAVDVNPVTLGLQAVAASAWPDWHVKLELADYRTWLESYTPSEPTLYLGNPPYTRWQLLDVSQRAKLLESAAGLVGVRANLSTIFLAMTLAKMRPEDSLAMIVPAGWMHADYGKPLRLWLREAAHRRVTLRFADSWRFDNATVDAIVVEVGPEADTTQSVQLSDWSISVSQGIDRAHHDAPFPPLGVQEPFSSPGVPGGVKLGRLARVSRGTATGANEFFVLSPDRVLDLGIKDEHVRPLARRIRHRAGTDSPVVEIASLLVLDAYQPGSDTVIDALLAEGEAAGVSDRHLCGKRRSWFDLSSEVKIPDVVISALAKEKFHVVVNAQDLVITNNLFGLRWDTSVTMAVRQQVVRWLCGEEGQAALKVTASVEANKLYRLSPRAVMEIVVPIEDHETHLRLSETVDGSRRS